MGKRLVGWLPWLCLLPWRSDAGRKRRDLRPTGTAVRIRRNSYTRPIPARCARYRRAINDRRHDEPVRADRRRGLDAGADAYLVKSAFDQRELLETVAELLEDT